MPFLGMFETLLSKRMSGEKLVSSPIYFSLPTLVGSDWTTDIPTERVQAIRRFMNGLSLLGGKLRLIRNWKELNGLPLHTIIFDNIIRQEIPHRVIGFDYYEKGTPESVNAKVKSIMGNVPLGVKVDSHTCHTYLVAVIPSDTGAHQDRYCIAAPNASNIKDIESDTNWTIKFENPIYTEIESSKTIRNDSSILLVGNKTTERIISESDRYKKTVKTIHSFAKQAGGMLKTEPVPAKEPDKVGLSYQEISGDIPQDVLKLGGEFTYIPSVTELRKIPMYTILRIGGHYVRVVKIHHDGVAYISLHVRTIKGNKMIGTRPIDSILTEVSFVNFFVARKGDLYITAPARHSSDPKIVESAFNYVISIAHPKKEEGQYYQETALANYHLNTSQYFLPIAHSRVREYPHSYQQAKPILKIFDSDGKLVQVERSLS